MVPSDGGAPPSSAAPAAVAASAPASVAAPAPASVAASAPASVAASAPASVAPLLTQVPATIKRPVQNLAAKSQGGGAAQAHYGPRGSVTKARENFCLYRTWRPSAYDSAFDSCESLTQVSGDELVMRLVVPVLLADPLSVFPFGFEGMQTLEPLWRLIPLRVRLEWRDLDSNQRGYLSLVKEAPVLSEARFEDRRPQPGSSIEIFGPIIQLPEQDDANP
jgi:hypothetical protein